MACEQQEIGHSVLIGISKLNLVEMYHSVLIVATANA